MIIAHMTGLRKRSKQFKLYFSELEKADLVWLARRWKRLPSEVLRELLRREIERAQAIPYEETSSPENAVEAVDDWIDARRKRRAEYLRTGR